MVSGHRDSRERSMTGLQSMFSRQEDDEWLAEWAALPDIREEGE